jgi:hypothetical protein
MSKLRCGLLPAHIDVAHVIVKRAPPTTRHGLFLRLHQDGTIAEIMLHHETGQVRMLLDIGEVLARFDTEIIYIDGTTAMATGQGLPERHPLPPGFNLAEWLESRLLVLFGFAAGADTGA